MAIDTAAKRMSALDMEEVWAEAIPIPDGAVSQTDRQHLIWSYTIAVIAWDGTILVYSSSRGQTIRAIDLLDVTATINHEHGHVSNLEGYGVTISVPTPGAEITLHQPGVVLIMDLIE